MQINIEKENQNQIIASISHDIKTPLTSVIGYSDRLRNKNLSDDKKEKYINKIYRNIEYEHGKLIICDKFNTTNKLLKDIPKINNEYDAFKLFERMI